MALNAKSRVRGRRIGFAIRYIPATIGQRDGLRNFATLVRGNDHGNFALERSPPRPSTRTPCATTPSRSVTAWP